MTERNPGKLNQLERTLPEGMVADAAWMEARGYSSSLRSQYVAAGWLEQPVRGTFKRPLGRLSWQGVVLSLQTLLKRDLVVGGATALDLHGLTHYVAPGGPRVIHLYGTVPPPNWLAKLPLPQTFHFHRTQNLFRTLHADEDLQGGTVRALHDGDSALILSTPERAFLELLDELPGRQSFHNVDMIAEGLRTLSPRRLNQLLHDCRSIKVKRLFFWFADRHSPPWLSQIDKKAIDLGSGKRMIVKGGRLDATYLITVPEDLSAPV